jgi:hypothetical protein
MEGLPDVDDTFELVPDGCSADRTKTARDAEDEVFYGRADLMDDNGKAVCEPGERRWEELQLISGDLDTTVGSPFPLNEPDHLRLECINSVVAVATVCGAVRQLDLAEVEDLGRQRRRGLEARLTQCRTKHQFHEYISELRSLGRLFPEWRDFCADLMRRAYEARAQEPEKKAEEKKQVRRPLVDHLYDTVQSKAHCAAFTGPDTVYASGTPAIYPQWRKSWLRYDRSCGRIGVTGCMVAVAQSTGSSVHVALLTASDLLRNKAPTELLFDATYNETVGPVRHVSTTHDGRAIVVTFDQHVLCILTTVGVSKLLRLCWSTFADVENAPVKHPEDAEPIATCAILMETLKNGPNYNGVIRVGTRAGSVYTIHWPSGEVVAVEDLTLDVPVLNMHNYGFTGSYIVRTVSDTRVVYEQSLLKPYRMVVSRSLGASACGSLVCTLSDTGLTWIADAHSHGVQRHIDPLPDMILKYEGKRDGWTGPEDPEKEDVDMPEADKDDVVEEAPKEGDDKADKTVQKWELMVPATYVYDGIYLDRNTLYILYPEGRIRKIFLAETYEKKQQKATISKKGSFLPTEAKKKKKKNIGKKKVSKK